MFTNSSFGGKKTMNYLVTTLTVVGLLTVSSVPSIAAPDGQAQEHQDAQSNRNLLNNQTNEIPEVSPENEPARTSSESLCPALAGMEPGSWEYREELDRCQYGS
jgi:hypothetical protein